MSSPNEYTCAMCGNTYTKAWSDEEAKAELEENFPDFEADACDIMCDDCYKRVMGGSSEH